MGYLLRMKSHQESHFSLSPLGFLVIRNVETKVFGPTYGFIEAFAIKLFSWQYQMFGRYIERSGKECLDRASGISNVWVRRVSSIVWVGYQTFKETTSRSFEWDIERSKMKKYKVSRVLRKFSYWAPFIFYWKVRALISKSRWLWKVIILVFGVLQLDHMIIQIFNYI